MNPQDDKKKFKETLIRVLVLFAVILYFGLHMGHAAWLSMQNGAIDFFAMMDGFSDNVFNPLYIWPAEFAPVIIVMMLWLYLASKILMDYQKNRNTMAGREHGSASFNYDFKHLLRFYIMSPKLMSEHFGKNYPSIKAPGGCKVCKKKNFTQKEINYCKSQSQIYTQNVCLSMDTRLSQRNLNAVVFGGSGAGKSRFFVLPNLLQANSSYVVTDPSGELMAGVGKFLESKGYVIRCLNIENMAHSNRYNPFAYIHKDSDILIMVRALVDNIEGPRKGGSGDNKFWDETSTTLLAALVGYLFEVCRDDNEFLFEDALDADGDPVVDEYNHRIPRRDADGNPVYRMRQKRNIEGLLMVDGYGNPVMEKVPNPHWKGCQNFSNLLRLLDLADVSDDREEPEDGLDKLFHDLELANPASYAVKQYKVIKQAGTGKTAQNIIISTTAIFARFFGLDEIANLTFKDELHLEELGKRKMALFIVTPQGDTTYNFLASMCYTQLFATLYDEGAEGARQRGDTSVQLDVPVRCLIDEAANIGVIPNFAEKISTMRKYGISACPIYQNQSQVRALFRDDWETIVGNCDTMLFLGGIDASTVKTVSERLGRGTINTHSETLPGGNKSVSTGINTAGRELMTTTEIEQMPNDKAICFIRGMKPWLDTKYPLEKHPNYKYSGMADDENSYHMNRVLIYDRDQMARTMIRAADDPDYIKPERVEGASQAEIARVRARLDKEAETFMSHMPEGSLMNEEGEPVPKEVYEQVTAADIEMETYDESDKNYDQSIIDNLRSNPIGQMLLNINKQASSEEDGSDDEDNPFAY